MYLHYLQVRKLNCYSSGDFSSVTTSVAFKALAPSIHSVQHETSAPWWRFHNNVAPFIFRPPNWHQKYSGTAHLDSTFMQQHFVQHFSKKSACEWDLLGLWPTACEQWINGKGASPRHKTLSGRSRSVKWRARQRVQLYKGSADHVVCNFAQLISKSPFLRIRG